MRGDEGENSAILLSAAFLMGIPSAAFAGPIDFDCDVPSDHFSDIVHRGSTSLGVTGAIRVVDRRDGENLPVAGVRLRDSTESNTLGFQLISSTRRATQLDAVLNLRRAGRLESRNLGQVDARNPIPFLLTLSDDGVARLWLGNISHSFEFPPMADGSEQVFCSTGQFEISGLMFGYSEGPAPAP